MQYLPQILPDTAFTNGLSSHSNSMWNLLATHIVDDIVPGCHGQYLVIEPEPISDSFHFGQQLPDTHLSSCRVPLGAWIVARWLANLPMDGTNVFWLTRLNNDNWWHQWRTYSWRCWALACVCTQGMIHHAHMLGRQQSHSHQPSGSCCLPWWLATFSYYIQVGILTFCMPAVVASPTSWCDVQACMWRVRIINNTSNGTLQAFICCHACLLGGMRMIHEWWGSHISENHPVAAVWTTWFWRLLLLSL